MRPRYQLIQLLLLATAACDSTLTLGDPLPGPQLPPMSTSTDASKPPPVLGDLDASSGGQPVVPMLDAVAMPEPTIILWSTDHETADLSAWQSGGPQSGGTYDWTTGFAEISTDVAHSGTHSFKFQIDTADAPSAGARAYRILQPEPAYYSAWFYLDQEHTPDDWWSIFLTNGQVEAPDPGNLTDLWELRVVRHTDASLRLQFYDRFTDQTEVASDSGIVPVAEWFHIEGYVDYSPPSNTTLRFWMNGVLLFDKTRLSGEAPGQTYWAIGNGAQKLTPDLSTLYVDDAAIATGRLGP